MQGDPLGEGGPGQQQQQIQQVGWGGSHISLQHVDARVPWFGRSSRTGGRQHHNQNQAQRGRHRGGIGGGAGGAGGGGSGGAPRGGNGGAPPPFAGGHHGGHGGHGGGGHGGGGAMQQQAPDALPVDELVALARRAPRGQPLPSRVFAALGHLDSCAAALLLKDLAKAGLEARAAEIFDALRALPDGHALRALCDVYTYTAMVSLCAAHPQGAERAAELLREMQARGVERNVHTYTALMNVCIKVCVRALALALFWFVFGGVGRRCSAAACQCVAACLQAAAAPTSCADR